MSSPTSSLIVLFALLAMHPALPAQQAAPPTTGVARTSQHVFDEIPGVRTLSSRMIVRPWPRQALRAAGYSPDETRRTREDARRTLQLYHVLEHIPATDDSILQVPAGMSEAQVADHLMGTGLFEYAEPDWLLAPLGAPAPAPVQHQLQGSHPAASAAPVPSPTWPTPRNLVCPDDPLFPSQWAHTAAAMDSCAAWGLWGGVTGDPSVTIAFCDTGVRTTHEDLSAHRLEGYNAVDQLWESQGGIITPVFNHGTRTTGSAAAQGNNGVGVAGVGWNFSHRMVRVSNMSNGNAFLTDIQHGARTAIESGDRIASVSYHGASSSSNAGTAAYIRSLGGILLWGAGNTSSNYSQPDRDDDDLIVVGATAQDDTLAYFSSYGNFIDLVAPGVGIVTTDSSGDSSYVTVEGTSYACPIAAGVCAMIWNQRPTLSPSDVERILKLSSEDIGASGLDMFFGYGRVNLARALQSPWSAPPASGFSAVPATGVSPLEVSFHDLSTGVPTDWLWDFGDGATSTLQHPVHTYTASGPYTVTLTAANELGLDTHTIVDAVLVDVIPPVADFTASLTGGLSPMTVDFTDTSTGGVPTSWLWDFGDGTTSTLQAPSTTYTTSGFYTVSLTVTNAYGSSTKTSTNVIAVDFIPPVAGFSATPTSGASPYVVSFTDESAGGVATAWSWIFGDGGSSSLQHPTHTYTAEGLYSVRLTVSNAYGSDDLWLINGIEVLPGPEILADFTASPTTGSAPLQVDFTDLSVGNIVSWDWNFGDGTTSTDQHPSHLFASPGEYDVALQVTNANGKDDCLEQQGFVTVQ